MRLKALFIFLFVLFTSLHEIDLKIGVMTRSQESGPVSKPPKPGCNCDHSLDVDLIKASRIFI